MINQAADKVLVSIIIPYYNCQYVGRAVASAQRQTYPNIEIIVVDDGSTLYMEQLAPYMKGIRYIRKSNGGTASALNEGIRQARGNYFVWLSSDDELQPAKVRAQLAFMQRRGYMISFTNFNKIDSQGRLIAASLNKKYTDQLTFYRDLKEFCPVNGSTVMAHMSVMRNIGAFNEKLQNTQDYEMWMRIALHYEFGFLDVPLTHYRVHEKMGSKLRSDVSSVEIAALQEIYRPKIAEHIRKLEAASR
ncbi:MULTISPECIES: glycosyltransferase family 2 protein [Bacillaceae]|uniref:Glycosyltransferase family 2 protein n=1 Tax=Bacillus infantis TaxID=324767 RepID=A0A5D4SPX1_9BACI|nr:glycosyltransferase family 2 protein [Bacillus infantis]MDW2878471.1 glycosyltransferase family 2 protein [Bacillus infantis]TYS65387.1 glycosyltransferase family 2 protein [Bacillus infantis]